MKQNKATNKKIVNTPIQEEDSIYALSFYRSEYWVWIMFKQSNALGFFKHFKSLILL